MPSNTGKHRFHVEKEKLNCDSCHKGRQHDEDVHSGTIDIGGVEYDPIPETACRHVTIKRNGAANPAMDILLTRDDT
ncbi:hypothetical protein J7M22_06765 [Candidatus Poribacteria bacterium]|nr:hypothetical protein [Candidatus Poribacteria bacterium]